MSTVDTNPLLKIEFRVPFDRIRAEDVQPAVEKHLQRAQERIDRIIALEGPRNFENTMLALDDATEELEYAVGVVRHLESVATYPELRAAYNAAQPKISAFYSSLPLNEALWNAIKSYAATDDAKALTGPHKRYLEKTLASFRRHGADLDAAGKARMAELDVELAKLTTKFSENVLDSTNAFELVITGEAQLSGLPESAREAARENGRSKGIDGWRFTLQAPSFLPLVTYSDLPELREKVYRAYHSRATAGDKDNRPLLNRIL
jgi:oligopeptidase A